MKNKNGRHGKIKYIKIFYLQLTSHVVVGFEIEFQIFFTFTKFLIWILPKILLNFPTINQEKSIELFFDVFDSDKLKHVCTIRYSSLFCWTFGSLPLCICPSIR